MHGRCDLACAHCYVYRHADTSWAAKPARISARVVRRAAERIAEHCAERNLPEVAVVLHGGEPLLVGHQAMRDVLAELKDVLGRVTEPRLHIQTNGVRLDPAFCELFTEFEVGVGVSLDGDRASNDRHRVFASGRTSHPQTLRALALLREYPSIYSGVLCTIDVRNDPIAVYEALLAESPPGVDLLLPHATWDDPPLRPDGAATPYADWLGRLHARWVADGRPVPIRLFDSLASLARGGPSWTEAIGPGAVGMLTIETDGGWELADSLKTAYDGAPATGMDIFAHSVAEAAAHPRAAVRATARASLSPECRACSVVDLCGGGLYAHRYRTGSGFANPSVYCPDLLTFITRTFPRAGRPAAPSKARHGVHLNDAQASPRALVIADAGERPETRRDAASAARAGAGRVVRALARGTGDVGAWRVLDASHAHLGRVMTAEVAGRIGGGTLGRVAADGWELLCGLEEARREAVREVFAYPLVQAWAARCLGADGRTAELDIAHLAAVALAAAQRAGVEAELSLVVREGAVRLPGLGAFRADGTLVRVRSSADGPRLVDGEGEWLGLRRHSSRWLAPVVDDLDPFRGMDSGLPPAARLSAKEWALWDEQLAFAGEVLERYVPEHRVLISAGLRVVVPLVQAPDGAYGSQTFRHAFGTVSVAFPGDPEVLAELLLHEFQHVKLNGLLDLCDLSHRGKDVELRVPWVREPRPVEAALHGAYAFGAVAEFWRARLREDGRERSRERFAHFRERVGDVPERLLTCGALTAAGREFARGLIETGNGWAE
ncbi:FxsB family cyclophane-forming radical SAM/SPASM peptide maturase [Spirillospora sp. CA-294931]|uniref:FxsB family cyclophane-forming radical SAM/SPASM peptide maturase n=1 Tax=Spirillospora sp. CA-294931 TaxID=3240042 RepID=UPI003D93C7F5